MDNSSAGSITKFQWFLVEYGIQWKWCRRGEGMFGVHDLKKGEND